MIAARTLDSGVQTWEVTNPVVMTWEMMDTEGMASEVLGSGVTTWGVTGSMVKA